MSEIIRNMTFDEVQTLVDWAASEGWNPGLNDAKLFWDVDPEGFLAIEVDGKLAGGGAIVRHNERFGFMGLFIVKPEFRGMQLGRKLWLARRDRLLSRLGTNATIGLDGVDAMVGFYAAGGFQELTRHRRFTLATPASAGTVSQDIVELADVDFAQVKKLDEVCFPGERDRYLSSWIGQPQAVSLGLMSGQILLGFGVMRPCRVGWKIGPLIAQNREIAEALIAEFISRCDQQPIFIDVPDNHPSAVAMCHSLGMEEVFGCTRMYLGPAPHIDLDTLFAITTLEIG